jgi:hypothetical protein
VTFADLQQKTLQLLRLDPRRLTGGSPGQLFVTPTGKYVIKRIEVIDGNGVKRSWTGSEDGYKFAVKSYCLSNLGRWTFTPQGAAGLAVNFESIPNTFKEPDRSRENSSVAAVIEGPTGSVQAIIAGKRAFFGVTAASGGWRSRGCEKRRN